jgi:hemerythrin-like metal-binding protein
MMWNDILLTGHPEIDGYHRRICQQLDNLKVYPEVDTALSAITWLFSVIADHFQQEEALMEPIYGTDIYPHLEEHVRHHREGYDNFILLRARLLKSIADKESSSSVDRNIATLINSLENWLIGHVFEEDKRFAMWLKKYKEAQAG